MAQKHESMKRLYAAAARRDPSCTRPVDLANALNESSQTVKNWEYRGVSRDGALDAQRRLGISATYLLDGIEPALIGESQPARPDPDILAKTVTVLKNLARMQTGVATFLYDAPSILKVYDEVSRSPPDIDLDREAVLGRMAAVLRGMGDGEGMGRGDALGAR
jgi:hypothetical protein